MGSVTFTQDELKWLREILSDYELGDISPSYLYLKTTQKIQNESKESDRYEFDEIRQQMLSFVPRDLMELKRKAVKEALGIKNFSGIYLIYNRSRDFYYVGQSTKVFERAYKHFMQNDRSHNAVYSHYREGDSFEITFIPLEYTPYSSLNELERRAIIVYNAQLPYGYNRISGNILDKAIFKNENHKEAAHLILNKIIEVKGKDTILELTNTEKRTLYVFSIISDFDLPNNYSFRKSLRSLLKEYSRANK